MSQQIVSLVAVPKMEEMIAVERLAFAIVVRTLLDASGVGCVKAIWQREALEWLKTESPDRDGIAALAGVRPDVLEAAARRIERGELLDVERLKELWEVRADVSGLASGSEDSDTAD